MAIPGSRPLIGIAPRRKRRGGDPAYREGTRCKKPAHHQRSSSLGLVTPTPQRNQTTLYYLQNGFNCLVTLGFDMLWFAYVACQAAKLASPFRTGARKTTRCVSGAFGVCNYREYFMQFLASRHCRHSWGLCRKGRKIAAVVPLSSANQACFQAFSHGNMLQEQRCSMMEDAALATRRCASKVQKTLSVCTHLPEARAEQGCNAMPLPSKST